MNFKISMLIIASAGFVFVMACGRPDSVSQIDNDTFAAHHNEVDSSSIVAASSGTNQNQNDVYRWRYESARALANYLVKENEDLRQQTGINIRDYVSLTAPVGYTFHYPRGWRLDDCTNNGCQIFSYDWRNLINPGAPVPSTEVKIELVFSTTSDTPSYETEPEEVLAAIDLRIGTMTGKRVWMIDNAELGAPCLETFLTERNRTVQIVCWPYNTRYAREYDEVVRSFRFIW